MRTKDKDIEESNGEEDEPLEAETEAVDQELEAQGGEADGLPYEVLKYAGKPLYRCRACAYDTTSGPQAILAHIADAHKPPAAPKALVLIADKSGKEVKK